MQCAPNLWMRRPAVLVSTGKVDSPRARPLVWWGDL